jgi:hypothetical protein
MIKGREGKRGEGKERRQGKEGKEGRGGEQRKGWDGVNPPPPPENKSWLRPCMKLTTQFLFCIVAFVGFTKLTKKSDNSGPKKILNY